MKIKHKHHLSLPHLSLGLTSPMQLSPVTADNDELTQAIDNEVQDHDDNWQLGNPDAVELEKFWSDVEADVRTDPDWVDFSKE